MTTNQARCAALRAQMAEEGLIGFIVPHADAFGGESLPPRDRRLEWLTGFTGSAGCAVVLSDTAAIFVDGRYTVQVAQDVDTSLFTPQHLLNTPVTQWLDTALHPHQGGVLGYDPWLHTPKQVEELNAVCRKRGVTLRPCPHNPLDAVWPDQPAPPSSEIFLYPQELSGRSSTDKRAALAKLLRDEGLDGVFLSDPTTVAWLTNLRGNDVEHVPVALLFALFHADDRLTLFVDPARLLARSTEIQAVPAAELLTHMTALGAQKIRFNPDQAPAAVVQAFSDGGGSVVPGPDPCALIKAVKNPVELVNMREVHRHDGVAMLRFLLWLDDAVESGTPISEISLAERLESFRALSPRYRGPSFATIAGSGPNGAIVHYHATAASNRTLHRGDSLLLDSGGQYWGGTTDVTRTLSLGPCENAALRRHATAVLQGHIALTTARFPKGSNGAQLDGITRAPLWRQGIDYDHGTGHGVGCYLSVHEGPAHISKRGSVPLQAGMVLSIEPGYYQAGAYGIRWENLVEVTEDPDNGWLGFAPLTLIPFDTRLLDLSLLTAAERGWLNRYHQRVADEIKPLLTGETERQGLAHLTAAV